MRIFDYGDEVGGFGVEMIPLPYDACRWEDGGRTTSVATHGGGGELAAAPNCGRESHVEHESCKQATKEVWPYARRQQP